MMSDKERVAYAEASEWPSWSDEEEPVVADIQSADSGEHDPDTLGFKDQDTDAGGSGGGFFGGDSDQCMVCDECERRFSDSWLCQKFACKVCDDCRDRDGRHSLITKTDAKTQYLLRDSDFDSREPPLRCIIKKNPHNSNWGNMKLFLLSQVEERALEVWGSEEALEAEREKRDDRKEKGKKRTFDKMIKELRMNARSSLGKQVHLNHEHEYEEEIYDEERDIYCKKCKKCDQVNEYEKM